MVLDGRAWTAFAQKVAVPEVVVLLVFGDLAPAVAYQHLLDSIFSQCISNHHCRLENPSGQLVFLL